MKTKKELEVELKHLAPYLPYGLKMKHKGGNDIEQMEPHHLASNFGYNFKNRFEIILRPLSDLDEEIEFNAEKFIPMDKIIPLIDSHRNELNKALEGDPFKGMLINLISSNEIFLKLLEYHFDVFGLIEKGLAIDINTL